MSLIQKYAPTMQLVVAMMRSDGCIDPLAVQPLDQWHRGPRHIELIRHSYGATMLDVLTRELGLVSLDEDGLLRSSIIIVTSEEAVKGAVMRLLGKIAEAIVVRRCNEDVALNRRWGQIGRRGRFVHNALDDFIAIGTGLETTRQRFPQKYSPTDSHRDVIWVHRDDTVRELQMLAHGRPAGISAGIQLKVSTDGYRYVYRQDIARAKYEVPLVYFDLRNDYNDLTNAIYAEDREVVIGVDIVRGADVDPALHDELLSYYHLAEALVRGQITPDDLVSTPLLADAAKKDVLESRNVTVASI